MLSNRLKRRILELLCWKIHSLKNGTNLRAGTISSVTDGTNVKFNEVSTVDLGDTSDVKFSVVLSSGDLLFKATVLSNNWDIKALVRKL